VIQVVDYGLGNVRSIVNMFKRIGVQAGIAAAPAQLHGAGGIVLPGVGHFDKGMALLEAGGWIPVLDRLVREQQLPVLGICLGMQLMTRSSEEGGRAGLGWIAATTIRLRFPEQGRSLVVPHMGWNVVRPRQAHPLLPQAAEWRFYFVHSYHVVCGDAEDILAESTYGIDFCSAFAHGNIVGVQFHPEKSHRFGMRFLKCFAEGVTCSAPA
jgi:glutamine amidotransferase